MEPDGKPQANGLHFMPHITRIVAFWLGVAAGVLSAQEPGKTPAKRDVKAEMAALAAAHKADLDDGAAGYKKWTSDLQAWYVAGLDKLQGETLKAGDLEGVLAFKAERERIAAGAETTQEQTQAMPAKLGKLRAAYESARKKVAGEAARRKAAASGKYLANLEALQKRLTVGGDLDDALLVKNEKEQFGMEEMLLRATEQVSQRQVMRTPILGGKGGTFHEDLPQPTLVLAGLRLGIGQDGRIKSLQPIYRNGAGDVDGNTFGQGERGTVLVAKPGYGVGAILLKPGDRLYGIQLTFMRILTASSALDQNDSYKSEWLGGPAGGDNLQSLNGAGHLIVGVSCRSAVDVDAMGLLVLP